MLPSLTAAYNISFQLRKKSNNNEQCETMVKSTRKENSPLMRVLLWNLKVTHLLMFSVIELMSSLYLQLRKN